MFYYLKSINEERKIESLEFQNSEQKSLSMSKYMHNNLPNTRKRYTKHILLFLIFFKCHLVFSQLNVFEYIEKSSRTETKLTMLEFDSVVSFHSTRAKSLDLIGKSFTDAITKIVYESSKYDFVFIDEVHFDAIHQIFMSNVLSKLNPDRTVFCAELLPTDTGCTIEFNRNLTGSKFGNYYDPTYSEAIHTALSRGIKTYSFANYKRGVNIYDTIEKSDTLTYIRLRGSSFFIKYKKRLSTGETDLIYGGMTSIKNENNDDFYSYSNLKQIKKLNPNKTIFVFTAGTHGHRLMENTLADFLGKEYKTLSVSQVQYKNNTIKTPVIMSSNIPSYDLIVIHPDYSLDRLSSNFVFNYDENRKRININLSQYSKYIPFKLFVFDSKQFLGDSFYSVPLDVIHVKDKKALETYIFPYKSDSYVLYLKTNEILFKIK